MGFWRGEDRAALLASTAGASVPADAGGQARRILAEGGYQSALPATPAPVDLEAHSLSLGPWELLLRALLWAALAVAVGLLAVWLWRRLARGVKDAAAVAPEVLAPLEVPIAGAEALAAAGRFAEAIHSLLLETLAALSRTARLAQSQTSREVLARTPLPGRAREALAGLVSAVEVSRFGGAAATEADYRACLARFHAFLETYRQGGPAAGEAA
jgi:hypothetical protein